MKINFKPTESIELRVLWALMQADFIHLKLAGSIDWSWFWIFTPIWGVLSIIGITIGIILMIKGLKK